MPWLQHVLDRVEASPVRYEPWPCSHMKVSDIFPVDFYAQLIANRPSTKQCTLLNKDKPYRYIFYPRAETAWWSEVRGRLGGAELATLLAEKFGIHGSCGDFVILHDKPGNVLNPHTDTPNKTLTGLLYLAADESAAAYGTALIRSRSGFTSMGDRDFPWSADFEQADLMPYLPNTALFFPVTNCSWHAAVQTKAERWIIDYVLTS